MAIDELEAKAAACSQAIEELVEEHGGEEGLLEEAKNDNDKVNKVSAVARMRTIGRDPRGHDIVDTSPPRRMPKATIPPSASS